MTLHFGFGTKNVRKKYWNEPLINLLLNSELFGIANHFLEAKSTYKTWRSCSNKRKYAKNREFCLHHNQYQRFLWVKDFRLHFSGAFKLMLEYRFLIGWHGFISISIMIFFQPSKIKLISGNLYIASPSQTRAAARFTRKLRFIDDFNSFSSGKFCSTKVDQGRPRSIQGHKR